MKRIASILSILVSAVLLVVMTMLPHHHHGVRLCFEMEQCDEDGSYNDVHTSHPVDHDGQAESSTCPFDTETDIREVQTLNAPLLLVAVLSDNIEVSESLNERLVLYADRKDGLHSLVEEAVYGLRAPPVI